VTQAFTKHLTGKEAARENQLLFGRDNQNPIAAEAFTKTAMFRELDTERLRLIKLDLSFIDDIYSYASDPEVTRYVSWPRHETRDFTLSYLQSVLENYARGGCYDWGIKCVRDDRLIGTIGLINHDSKDNSFEIGYVLSKTHWNRGFATEAASRVIDFALTDLKASRIKGICHIDNTRSARVMEKCGMRFIGEIRHTVIRDDTQVECRLYCIEGDADRDRRSINAGI
jgi:ribosomal-protein-alanine N-acetyltransferase